MSDTVLCGPLIDCIKAPCEPDGRSGERSRRPNVAKKQEQLTLFGRLYAFVNFLNPGRRRMHQTGPTRPFDARYTDYLLTKSNGQSLDLPTTHRRSQPTFNDSARFDGYRP
jgi:hypothetical protein